MERTEMRERKGDHGQREFCEIQVRLHEGRFSICGTAGVIVKHRDAKRQALEYWTSFFEDEPSEIYAMNERFSRQFRTAKGAAKFVLETDGELHGVDVVQEDGNDVYIGHSFGQIRDEIAEFFPEVTPFFRWHLNDMNAGCVHQDARGETYTDNPGAECLECGCKLGHAWNKRELPPEVVRWAETGEGHCPSEPHYIAGPQFVVSGKRTPIGSIGNASESFKLNGTAPDEQAARAKTEELLRPKYDWIHILSVEQVEVS